MGPQRIAIEVDVIVLGIWVFEVGIARVGGVFRPPRRLVYVRRQVKSFLKVPLSV